jgi:hypothetical protein
MDKKTGRTAFVRPSFETAACGGLLRMRIFRGDIYNPHGEEAHPRGVSNHEADAA